MLGRQFKILIQNFRYRRYHRTTIYSNHSKCKQIIFGGSSLNHRMPLDKALSLLNSPSNKKRKIIFKILFPICQSTCGVLCDSHSLSGRQGLTSKNEPRKSRPALKAKRPNAELKNRRLAALSRNLEREKSFLSKSL